MRPDGKYSDTRMPIGCSIASCGLIAVAIEALSFYFTGSLNPFSVYSAGTTFQVAIVSIALAFLSISILGTVGYVLQAVISSPKGPDPRILTGFGGCALLVVTLFLSYWFTGSLNPIDVFRTSNVLWIAVVAALLGLLVLAVVQFLSITGFVWRIERDTGKSFRDVYCKFCDDRIVLMVRTKVPLKCPHCTEWVHFSCWRNNGGNLRERCRSEECRREFGSFDLDSFFRSQ